MVESESKIKILRILSIIRLILLKVNTNLGLGSLNDHLHLCSCLIIIFFYFFSFTVLHEHLLFADLVLYQAYVWICSIVNSILFSFYFTFLAISFRINWGIRLELYILKNLSFYGKWLLHLFHIFPLFWKYTV